MLCLHVFILKSSLCVSDSCYSQYFYINYKFLILHILLLTCKWECFSITMRITKNKIFLSKLKLCKASNFLNNAKLQIYWNNSWSYCHFIICARSHDYFYPLGSFYTSLFSIKIKVILWRKILTLLFSLISFNFTYILSSFIHILFIF